MSRHEYAYIGYGFFIDFEPFYNLTINDAKKFAVYCDEEIKKASKDWETLQDVDDYMTDWNFNSGISGLFVNAVKTQENIELTDAQTESEHAILFEPVYPWSQCTEEEKNLTSEKLDEIFEKYQLLLGIPKESIVKPYYYTLVGYC